MFQTCEDVRKYYDVKIVNNEAKMNKLSKKGNIQPLAKI